MIGAVGAAAWMAGAGSALGWEIRVPCDVPTIQGAIDAARDGDVVAVAPGVYRESIVWADVRD
ncbi:MAG: hypothetical protein R3F14_36355 [Polyangiaceae bacterium]